MPPLGLPLGNADFEFVRKERVLYVDKTGFVREVLDARARVLVFARPPGFGKSSNLSMLACFLGRRAEDFAPLFEGLVASRDEVCLAHFQRHPVVHVRLAGVGAPDEDDALWALGQEVRRLYEAEARLLEEGALAPRDEARFRQILAGEADEGTLCAALFDLSRMLFEAHGERVVLLVDDYDAPLRHGATRRSSARAARLVRRLLAKGLRENPWLFKAVLTGVLCVHPDELFAGLCDLEVRSMARPERATWFGFSRDEAEALLRAADLPERIPGMRALFEGLRFGGAPVYEPRALIDFMARGDGRFGATHASFGRGSEGDLLGALLTSHGDRFHAEIEDLVAGRRVTKPIAESVGPFELDERPEALFSVLAMAGYVRAEPTGEHAEGFPLHALSISTRATRAHFRRAYRISLERRLSRAFGVSTPGHPGFGLLYEEVGHALLEGDAERLARVIEVFLGSFSSHDFPKGTPEKLYQIVVEMLALYLVPRFESKSNLEAGLGRCDVQILPTVRGDPGVAIEIKVLDTPRKSEPSKAEIESALAAAFQQIDDRRYDQPLQERGADPIHLFAIVFQGKRAWVEARRRAPTKPWSTRINRDIGPDVITKTK